MKFSNHTLPSSLSNFIESIFHYENFIPDHSIERVVPTGHIFLIFELDGFARNTYDNDSMEPNATFRNVWISGNQRKFLSISAHENAEMLIIQFKPFGFYPFFHQNVDLLTDLVCPAEEFLGNEILTLKNQILVEDEVGQKFSLVVNWLENRLMKDKFPPSELIDFILKLQKNPDQKFSELTASYPKSQKHLIDQFKRHVGLTPKYFHRMLRFNQILQQIKSDKKIAWSQIAYQLGYSDQSHFIKEFKYFSGFNPAEYIVLEYDRDNPNFFPLDRKS